jgi:hypothetical protein
VIQQGGTFKRTKHMIGRIGFLRDQLELGEARLVFTRTAYMLADMLTKPVSKDTIKKHLRDMGVKA